MKRKTSATAKKAVNKGQKGTRTRTLPQNIPEKPIVEVTSSDNAVTGFWRQVPFCDKYEVEFGCEANNLKQMPATSLNHIDIPKKDIPLDTDHWVRVRGINKFGAGEWSEPKLIRLTKAPTAAPTTKSKWFARGWKWLTAWTKKKNTETAAKNIGVNETLPSHQFEKTGWKIVHWLTIAGTWLFVIVLIALAYVLYTQYWCPRDKKLPTYATSTGPAPGFVTKNELGGVATSLAAINDQVAKMATKEEIAKLATKEDAKVMAASVPNATDYNAMIVARKGDATAQIPLSVLKSNVVVIIGDNNNPIINSAVVNAEQTQRPINEKPAQKETTYIPPDRVQARSPEQCPTTDHTYNEVHLFPTPDPYIGAYVDCQLTLNPGEYKEFIMPLRCHLDLYENNVHCIQFINGKMYVPEVYNPHPYIIRNYGLLNRSNWPVTVTIRLTRIGI